MEHRRRGGNKEKAILLFYEPRVLFSCNPLATYIFPYVPILYNICKNKVTRCDFRQIETEQTAAERKGDTDLLFLFYFEDMQGFAPSLSLSNFCRFSSFF